MHCYFVSSGVEIPMTSQTFDFIWNSFGNKELTDSETSSSSREGGKTGSLVEKTRHAERRKQDDGYYNRKPNDEKHYIKALANKVRESSSEISTQNWKHARNLGNEFLNTQKTMDHEICEARM